MTTRDTPKWRLRRRLSAAREAVPAAVREAEAVALAAAVQQAVAAAVRQALAATPLAAPLAAVPLPDGSTRTVCAYWPVGAEPGSPALLDALVHQGCRVLLPIVSAPLDRVATPLNWAEYTGPDGLRAGPLGLREPAGPALGCLAIATAMLVLVPALAVDRRGFRLGRGGGHYDRTLPLARAGTPLVAIVRDEEVLAALPAEPHDVPVTAALTPRQGLLPLGPP